MEPMQFQRCRPSGEVLAQHLTTEHDGRSGLVLRARAMAHHLVVTNAF